MSATPGGTTGAILEKQAVGTTSNAIEVVPDRDPGQASTITEDQPRQPMPAIPLQFVIALLLVIFLVRLVRREGGPPSRLFALAIAVYALQAVLYGLRWGYGIDAAAPPASFVAAIIPPLSWAALSGLTSTRAIDRRRLHLLPPLVAVLLYVLVRPAAFLAVVAIEVCYGIALVRLGRAGPDSLDRVQLDGAISVQRVLEVTGFMMIAEACVDLAITIDFIYAHGAHAAWIAGASSFLSVAVLGFTATVAGGSIPAADEVSARVAASSPPPSPAVEPEDGEIMTALEAAMQGRALYRDPELSLDRLARKLVIPARRISGAINRARGMNVSQYVNEHRVRDACRRLAETDDPVTQIMFEAGFQTKSNFNREFLRVTGKSPSAWRAENGPVRVGAQQ
jgi:AraC-like DNA-binding protein